MGSAGRRKAAAAEREFADAGLTALLGCGMAPGFVNVIARLYCDKLDTVDSIKSDWQEKNGGGKYDDFIKPWSPGWAPIQALKDSSDSPICFEGGAHRHVPAFDESKNGNSRRPVGKMGGVASFA